MHTWTARLSAVFSYACIVLAAATVFNAGTHFLLRNDPIISIQHSSLHKMGNTQLYALHNSGELHHEEHGVFVHFNLSADFTPAWTWNTHEIFVMVVAEFETPFHTKNHVVIWDKIITTKEEANLQLLKEFPDYPLTENTAELSNLAVSLVVKYDVIPIAGPLMMTKKSGMSKFSLPSQVTRLTTENAPRRFYAPNTKPY